MRSIHKLKPIQVKQLKTPGWYSDGGGLWLQVTSPAAKSWVFRFAVDGRERYMGLGSVNAISLNRARDEARKCREMRYDGIDPIEHRNAERRQKRTEAAKAMTFDECAVACIAALEPNWRNAVHARQWRTTLKQYASPVLGDLPVQTIDTALVAKVLTPIWKTKTVTASRLRERIESVLDWATVSGHRQGDNPARWRGHLEHVLAKPSKAHTVKHLAALPYAEINALVTLLRAQEGIAERALEFTILTAARTGETLYAKWSEIDMQSATWTVPDDRMKAGKEHRVPLSARAIAILEGLRGIGVDYVFPGTVEGRPLYHEAMLDALRRLGRTETVHGLRSSFRDWAAEQTSYPREVIEAALAHAKGKVDRAYQRGDLFEKRRRLMDEWARYCATSRPAGGVVPLRAVGKES